MAAMWARVSKHLVWLWLLVPLVAILEAVCQFWIPHMEPTQKSWQAAAAYAKSLKGERDLVVFAPRFASQGLVYLKGSISREDFGRFDASKYAHVIELSVNGATAPETAGLPLDREREFEGIAVRKYRNPKKADVRYDFTDHLQGARFSGKAAKHPKFLIDTGFTERLAIPIPPQKRPASVTFEAVPLEGEIYGYAFVAVTDFRREVYDRDGPLELEVFVDDKRVGKKIVNKGDALLPFRFKTDKKGVGTVRFQVRTLKRFTHYGFGFVADIRG